MEVVTIDRDAAATPTRIAPPGALIPAHAIAANNLCEVLATDLRDGLSAKEVRTRQAKFGPNRLAEVPAAPLWRKFVGQFAELIVLILIAAALVAVSLGEWLDAGAILAIVLMNGILGFLQEEKAQGRGR